MPIYNGTTWVYQKISQSNVADGNKITRQAMSSGPPASPTTGDIWIATAVGGGGEDWMFWYNGASGSAYKWEFLGGSPINSIITTNETTTTIYPSWSDLATVGPSVVVARGGDYHVSFGANGSNNTAGQSTVLGIRSTSVAEPDALVSYTTSAAANSVGSIFSEGILFSVTAGDTIKLRYSVTANTGTFERRRLHVRPVRVS